MVFNFISNIQNCYEMIQNSVPVSMVYYSHIPAAVAALMIGILVISKNRKLAGKLVFMISMIFALWSTIDIVLWTSTNSEMYMFFWSIIVILEALLFILNIYLVKVFADDKDISFWNKMVWFILLLPIFILVPTTLNISHFDIPSCMPINNLLYNGYAVPLYGLLLVWYAILIVLKLKKATISSKKQIGLISAGSFLFLFLFFVSNFLTDYLMNNSILSVVDSYKIEMYSLFAMPVFLALLSFVIVRFKAFDIKLIGAQALVWALVILIGSQFLYMDNMPLSSITLNAIALALSAGIGLMVVRSVKKEVALRESLEIANRNQESLIHFISHQLKGFFTKSKMIFSGILEGDFGEVTPVITDMAKTGLASDNNAVAMIQDILGASNLKTGTTQYNFKNVVLNDLVKKVCGLFTEEMNSKGLQFEPEITDKPINVMVDETQITQVFKNLIDNSLRYTPSGKIKVTLKKSNDGSKAIFEVSDSGIGLSESDKAKLFTEGGKGEESLKVNTNSTGYGLYIVKKIVDTHRGRIWAESAGRGHGSQFYVELNVVG